MKLPGVVFALLGALCLVALAAALVDEPSNAAGVPHAGVESYYENERLVALLGAFGWGTFAAALVPTVAIGFNWKRATAAAANTAILVSLAVNFGIELFGVALPWGISGGAVALGLSLLLFFGISFLSPPPRLDPDIEALLDV